MWNPTSVRSSTPRRYVKPIPGHPASACNTELPVPAVRAAVAVQSPSITGDALVSSCADAARAMIATAKKAAAAQVPDFPAIRIHRLPNCAPLAPPLETLGFIRLHARAPVRVSASSSLDLLRSS